MPSASSGEAEKASARVSGAALTSSASFPVATSGRRYQETRELVLLLHRGGLSKTAGLNEVADWLRRSAVSGTSKDLLGADSRRVQVFVKDAAGAWGWLDQHPRAPTAPKRIVALSTMTGLVPRSQRTTSSTSTPPAAVAFDRDRIRGAVTASDETRLATVEDRWLREKVRLLVGLLRLADREHGPLATVTIGSVVFDRIIGGRPPPTAAPVEAPAWGGRMPLSTRAALRWNLAELGYATHLDDGLKGKRASLFEVTLPPVDSDVASGPHVAAGSAPGTDQSIRIDALRK